MRGSASSGFDLGSGASPGNNVIQRQHDRQPDHGAERRRRSGPHGAGGRQHLHRRRPGRRRGGQVPARHRAVRAVELRPGQHGERRRRTSASPAERCGSRSSRPSRHHSPMNAHGVAMSRTRQSDTPRRRFPPRRRSRLLASTRCSRAGVRDAPPSFSLGVGAGADHGRGRLRRLVLLRPQQRATGSSSPATGSATRSMCRPCYFDAGRFKGGDTTPLGTEFGGTLQGQRPRPHRRLPLGPRAVVEPRRPGRRRGGSHPLRLRRRGASAAPARRRRSRSAA